MTNRKNSRYYLAPYSSKCHHLHLCMLVRLDDSILSYLRIDIRRYSYRIMLPNTNQKRIVNWNQVSVRTAVSKILRSVHWLNTTSKFTGNENQSD